MFIKILNITFLGLLMLIIPQRIYGQLVVDEVNSPQLTPEDLVNDILVGEGVEIVDIRFMGEEASIGSFTKGASSIGIDEGILLSTGFAKTAEIPNGPFYSGDPTSGDGVTDDDLSNLAQIDIVDISKLEIVFRPYSDRLRFKYVFASEEYPEFNCTEFNDIFAFFISGPNPDGGNYQAKNIALVPDPADPSGLSFLDIPVAINTINNGVVGSEALNGDLCTAPLGSLNYSEYYNASEADGYPVYDGYSDVFFAEAKVSPCEEYTIKLIIADGDDPDWDSAVFLEAKSFSSESLDVSVATPGQESTIAEGCGSAEIRFAFNEKLLNPFNIEVNILDNTVFPNAAVFPDDFELSSSQLIIQAGENFVNMEITAKEDGISESVEYIYLDVKIDNCNRDTLRIGIVDNQIPLVTLADSRDICEGGMITLPPQLPDGYELPQNQVYNNTNTQSLDKLDEFMSSSISVSNVEPAFLFEKTLARVCIDTLVHIDLTELDFYLKIPSGDTIQLSTDNGDRSNNQNQQDSLLNTCFSIFGNENINRGDPNLGPMDLSNPSYTGLYIPEGDWTKLYSNLYEPSNGEYQLLILDDTAGNEGTLSSWSLVFSPPYDLEYQWSENGLPIDCGGCEVLSVSPPGDTQYELVVTDTYGCTVTDTTTVTTNVIPESPVIVDCEVISPTEIKLRWLAVDDAISYEVGFVNNSLVYPTNNLEINIEGLIPNTTYTFKIFAKTNRCTSLSSRIECSTIPCTGPDPIIDSLLIGPPSCKGKSDGYLGVFASSDNAPLKYYLGTDVTNNPLLQNLPAGDYYLRVIDGLNCGVDTNIVLEEPAALSLEFDFEGVECRGDANGSIEAIPFSDNPPFTIRWNTDDETFLLENIIAGVYVATITDGNGCTLEDSIELVDPPSFAMQSFNIENNSCFGYEEASIEVFASGGAKPYSYLWDDQQQSITRKIDGLAAGVYNVTITDANECDVFESFVIIDPDEIQLEYEVLINDCFGSETSIKVIASDGIGFYNYEWSDGQEGDTGVMLSKQVYTVTVMDVNNCEAVIEIDLTGPAFLIDPTIQDLTCHDSDDGAITVLIQNSDTINYTIGWNDLANTFRRTGLSQGAHCFTIRDTNDCRLDTCLTVGAPNPISVDTLELVFVECFGDSSGIIDLAINGGTGAYSFLWEDASNDLRRENLTAGAYTITIEDDNECIYEHTIVIEESIILEYTVDKSMLRCGDVEDGFIEVFPSGGAEPYSYNWSNGATTSRIDSLAKDTFYVTITDDQSCFTIAEIEMVGPEDLLWFDIIGTAPSCGKTQDGEIRLEPWGGYPPYEFSFNGGPYDSQNEFFGLATGAYSASIRDSSGCEFFHEDVIVPEPSEIEVDLGDDLTFFQGEYVQIFPIVENATGNLQYQWSVQGSDLIECKKCEVAIIESVQGLNILQLTVVDEKGCAGTGFVNIFIDGVNEDDVKVPSGFSPNADGSNDVLNVFGKENITINSFRLYERWGAMIYESKNFMTNDLSIGWNGIYKGKEMPQGTYFWIVEFESVSGEDFVIKGSTSLIR